MSSGDVVCTGWLVKSPPEKKLKRYSWRKRWFVLRRGRMSGDPDVLEYFRSKSSRKPIRTIDLQECEVTVQTEVWPIKRHPPNQHLFVVKTANRVFYLLAKTAEEMNCWVRNIGQICTFSALNDSTESMDSLSHTPSSQQPSPALSPHIPFSATTANGDTAVRDTPSESDSSPPLDYLFLSQCETGRKCITRQALQCSWPTTVSQSQSEDFYVPMASPTVSSSDVGSDGYIPMTESPLPPAPDMEPPPVNRSLKPRRRCKFSVSRPFYFLLDVLHSIVSVLLKLGFSLLSGPVLNCGYTAEVILCCFFQKPLLDEQRVDYVQVDEKKTQALQNTKTEWKDIRQSKV
uniref:Si:ch73-92i20.1 n=1 Tax=Astyanax mexicanus TaxID=7994 RepID=A0A3B1J0F0_ASTMX